MCVSEQDPARPSPVETPPMSSRLPFATEKLYSKNKIGRGIRKCEKKGRQSSKFVMATAFSHQNPGPLALPQGPEYSQPYPLNCFADTETHTRWEKLTVSPHKQVDPCWLGNQVGSVDS